MIRPRLLPPTTSTRSTPIPRRWSDAGDELHDGRAASDDEHEAEQPGQDERQPRGGRVAQQRDASEQRHRGQRGALEDSRDVVEPLGAAPLRDRARRPRTSASDPAPARTAAARRPRTARSSSPRSRARSRPRSESPSLRRTPAPASWRRSSTSRPPSTPSRGDPPDGPLSALRVGAPMWLERGGHRHRLDDGHRRGSRRRRSAAPGSAVSDLGHDSRTSRYTCTVSAAIRRQENVCARHGPAAASVGSARLVFEKLAQCRAPTLDVRRIDEQTGVPDHLGQG